MTTTSPVLDALLIEFERRLVDAGYNSDLFYPPATIDEIVAAFEGFQFKPTDEILSMYTWHNGIAEKFPVRNRFVLQRHAYTFGPVSAARERVLDDRFDMGVWTDPFTENARLDISSVPPLWPLFQKGSKTPWIDLTPDDHYGELFVPSISSPRDGRHDNPHRSSLSATFENLHRMLDGGNYEIETFSEAIHFLAMPVFTLTG